MHYTLAKESLAEHGILWNHCAHNVLTVRQTATSYARWVNHTQYDDLQQRWILQSAQDMPEVLLLQYDHHLQHLHPYGVSFRRTHRDKRPYNGPKVCLWTPHTSRGPRRNNYEVIWIIIIWNNDSLPI